MKKFDFDDVPIGGINISPIINLALILVLGLFIIVPFLDVPNLNLKLPEAVTIETKEKNVSVSYTKYGQLAINQEIITIEELVPKLKNILKNDRDLLVIVRADKDVPHGEVEKIYDIIVNKVKARKIAVATEQRKQDL